LTPAERSERMSRIRSSKSSPELTLREALHALGFRFKLRRTDLPGKQDIVLPRYKCVVFVRRCFWHRHDGFKVATTPKSNTRFWVEKFDKNVARDNRPIKLLETQGWKVMVVWECERGSEQKVAEAVSNLAKKYVGIFVKALSRSLA
jgi:DNA mismatch endonuclease (patch repair protein)